MNIGIDTNVLLRTAQPNHPHYRAAVDAIGLLNAAGHTPVVLGQNLVEFWVVATRPIETNGMGLSLTDALFEFELVQDVLLLLPNPPDALEIWNSLVRKYHVVGKAAHDANIVAGLLANAVRHVMTFNVGHFRRFDEIHAFSPDEITALNTGAIPTRPTRNP